MGLGKYHVKTFVPHGVSDKTVDFFNTVVATSHDNEDISFAHLMAQILIEPFDSLDFLFGGAFLGWAQTKYSDELTRYFFKLWNLTTDSGEDIVSAEGGSLSPEGGSLQYLYAFPLLDLPSTRVVSQYKKISPFNNNERTHEILDWCYRKIVGGSLRVDPLVLFYCITAETYELAHAKIEEAERILFENYN